jgi:GTP:adenosylcobinamide-phosphate guanylyltransferase
VSTYDAIVPAGGTIDATFAASVGTDQKALIEFGGQLILDRILRALRESGVIRDIVVVGSKDVQERAAKFAAIGLDQGNSGPDNIFKGLDKLKEKNPDLHQVLIVTSDLPFLAPELIKRYVELCPSDKDICVPVIEAAEFSKAYPGTTSTFVKTKDGTFTIGGMFLMNAKVMPVIRASIEKVFAKRKSKLGMAALIGPAFAYKYLTKTLTIRDLERKIESMLGCTGKAVLGAPVELAYDIDYQDDYDYAVKLMEARA